MAPRFVDLEVGFRYTYGGNNYSRSVKDATIRSLDDGFWYPPYSFPDFYWQTSYSGYYYSHHIYEIFFRLSVLDLSVDFANIRFVGCFSGIGMDDIPVSFDVTAFGSPGSCLVSSAVPVSIDVPMTSSGVPSGLYGMSLKFSFSLAVNGELPVDCSDDVRVSALAPYIGDSVQGLVSSLDLSDLSSVASFATGDVFGGFIPFSFRFSAPTGMVMKPFICRIEYNMIDYFGTSYTEVDWVHIPCEGQYVYVVDQSKFERPIMLLIQHALAPGRLFPRSINIFLNDVGNCPVVRPSVGALALSDPSSVSFSNSVLHYLEEKLVEKFGGTDIIEQVEYCTNDDGNFVLRDKATNEEYPKRSLDSQSYSDNPDDYDLDDFLNGVQVDDVEVPSFDDISDVLDELNLLDGVQVDDVEFPSSDDVSDVSDDLDFLDVPVAPSNPPLPTGESDGIYINHLSNVILFCCASMRSTLIFCSLYFGRFLDRFFSLFVSFCTLFSSTLIFCSLYFGRFLDRFFSFFVSFCTGFSSFFSQVFSFIFAFLYNKINKISDNIDFIDARILDLNLNLDKIQKSSDSLLNSISDFQSNFSLDDVCMSIDNLYDSTSKIYSSVQTLDLNSYIEIHSDYISSDDDNDVFKLY